MSYPWSCVTGTDFARSIRAFRGWRNPINEQIRAHFMIPKIEIDKAIRDVERLGPFPYRSEEQVVVSRGVLHVLVAAAKVARITEVAGENPLDARQTQTGVPDSA